MKERYLLDSHILVWLRLEQKKIASIASLLTSENDEIFYSIVNPWELSIKAAKGKLRVPAAFFTGFSLLGFTCLPVKEEHIAALRKLPPVHHDPFDRMLVAQAQVERLTLVTADQRLAAYPIKTLPV